MRQGQGEAILPQVAFPPLRGACARKTALQNLSPRP